MAISSISHSPGTHSQPQRSLELALAAVRAAEDNRGTDIVVLDMRAVSPLFDYFVVATGTSRRQLRAISDEIDHTLEGEFGDHRLSVEGYGDCRWIVLDYGNIVVHLFDEETRQYYGLEDLWAEAGRVDLSGVLRQARPR